MAKTAILIGISVYRNLPSLACCHDDVLAIKQLLEATDKYDFITVIEDADADSLKQRLRDAVDEVVAPEELFFYFTGHGHARDGELFHCATNFDTTKPNETGLSTSELHTILRLADAASVVKVIDTCYSGTLLIKSQNDWLRQSKEGFRNLIQIASCLDSQNSLTGELLSLFTEKFRDAALRKTEGVVFYTDIISTLRDEFIGDDAQTPFFISQHTGREQFVDDARKLDGLRTSLKPARVAEAAIVGVSAPTEAASRLPTLEERLTAADAKVVTPELMKSFVGSFFNELIERIATEEFANFFEVERTEHTRFEEDTAEQFIIRVLINEKRVDNFVTATYSRKRRNRNNIFGAAVMDVLYPNDYEEEWGLFLNCTMERTQLKFTFTPKFYNLQRITLVVTCAPSLDHCYVFEVATEHLLQDFGKYDGDGNEITRRWWKLVWSEGVGTIAQQIAQKVATSVRQQLENAEKRLAGETITPSKPA